jgi:signal peptidase I
MTDLLRRRRWVFRVLFVVALFAILVSITFAVFVGLSRVHGDDMLPGLGDGAGLVFRKNAAPERGSVIIFDDGGATRIRRVIGLPGEHLEFDGMIPIVDGERASYEDRYEVDLYKRRMKVVRETIKGASHDVIDDPKRTMTNVPAVDTGDGYYVMADFREYGADSSIYGVVPRSAVRGVAWFAWSHGDRPARAK